MVVALRRILTCLIFYQFFLETKKLDYINIKFRPAPPLKRRLLEHKNKGSMASKSLVKKDEQVKKFPIKKVHESLQAKFPNERVIPEAAVYHSAILEYLTTEILELSANVARSRKKAPKNSNLEITLGDVQEAIQSDRDMRDLIHGCS